MEMTERVEALERQMREVRDALSLDDKNLTRDWVGQGTGRSRSTGGVAVGEVGSAE